MLIYFAYTYTHDPNLLRTHKRTLQQRPSSSSLFSLLHFAFSASRRFIESTMFRSSFSFAVRCSPQPHNHFTLGRERTCGITTQHPYTSTTHLTGERISRGIFCHTETRLTQRSVVSRRATTDQQYQYIRNCVVATAVMSLSTRNWWTNRFPSLRTHSFVVLTSRTQDVHRVQTLRCALAAKCFCRLRCGRFNWIFWPLGNYIRAQTPTHVVIHISNNNKKIHTSSSLFFSSII